MEVEIAEQVLAERDRLLEEARVLSLQERINYERTKPRCCGAYF